MPMTGTDETNNIHNSYGSITCIRFEGIISAPPGHPFVYVGGKGNAFWGNSPWVSMIFFPVEENFFCNVA